MGLRSIALVSLLGLLAPGSASMQLYPLRGPIAAVPTLVIEGVAKNTGKIYAVCADGTRVQGSFVKGSGTARGSGNATDTNGNVNNLLF